MDSMTYKAGSVLAKKNDKVTSWYIIQEGVVTQKNEFVETDLGANAIIGILEQDWFICDYIAKTDVKLIAFSCSGVAELHYFLEVEPRMRGLFIKTAMLQRHQQFLIYEQLQTEADRFANYVEKCYEAFEDLCTKNRLEIILSTDFNKYTPLEMQHKATPWEIANSEAITNKHLAEYMKLYTLDDDMCVGAIMEASASMRRVRQGIGEMISHFIRNKDVLLSHNSRDLYHGLLDLYANLSNLGKDVSEVEKLICDLLDFSSELGAFDQATIDYFRNDFTEFKNSKDSERQLKAEKISASSDLETILIYAEYDELQRDEIMTKILRYSEVYASDNPTKEDTLLRKEIIKLYFEIYKRCFFSSVISDAEAPEAVIMLMNFGYMDVTFLGSEKTNILRTLVTHLELCNSDRIYTMYNWLRAVYRGDKEPSKNEFDLDFPHYLTEQVKNGVIRKEDVDRMLADPHARAEFEIDNMFASVNRITYGSVTRYSPVLNGNDLFNDPDKMLITVDTLSKSLNSIREIDFSAYYRPVYSHGLGGIMTHEILMQEVLPDIILMPNAGTKAMMWQETSGVKSDTPARFMIPIFTPTDIDDLMMELTGRFRWEMCRKIQGARWNDVAEHSLTSEYYDYLQFYRKNRDLSPEVKESIKSTLARSKNNFREVFVRDYVNWLKYEAKGGFRLNKYVRRIMFAYVPFSKDVRNKLADSPMFKEHISRYVALNDKTLKRLRGVYDKYQQDTGDITQSMKENMDYYSM